MYYKIYNMILYKDIKFNKSNLHSPFKGRFDIYLSENEDIVYKKIKCPFNDQEVKIYKDIIYNMSSQNHIGKYIHSPESIHIEDDGSYYSKYIKNNVILYNIFTDKENIIDKTYLNDIIDKLEILLDDLCKSANNNIVKGDWAIHNILYDKDTKSIYNVDLEGFYTNPRLHNWDVNQINSITKWYKQLINKINKIMEPSKVLNIIKYVKQSGKDYSASHINIGYHSIELDGKYYRGQRDCVKRLEYIKDQVDVTGKNILDIGCCIGGMLFPLHEDINSGIGIDFNYKNINAGNKIAKHKKIDNIEFYQFDLDKEDHSFINNFTYDSIDITFLFSVCMWIKKWKELIDYIRDKDSILFIETNGSEKQQLEQLEYCKSKYTNVKILYDKSEDDPGQKKRKLYMCTI